MVASPSPALPLGDDAPPLVYLELARTAASRAKDRETAEALERAETRLLGERCQVSTGRASDARRAVLDIGVARRSLAAHDRAGAVRAIDDAIVALTVTAFAEPAQPPSHHPLVTVDVPPDVVTSPPSPVSPPPAAGLPAGTFALLPGRWQLDGYRYVWVPGDEVLRPVEPRSYAQGRYVWQHRAWVWVPGHFE